MPYAYSICGKETLEAPCFQQSIGYGYDSLGRLTSLTYPSGLVAEYVLDELGRPDHVSLKFGSTSYLLALRTPGPGGSTKDITFASGSSTKFNPDDLGRPGNWKVASRAGTVRSGDYTYDSERGLMTSTGDWTGITYDAKGRITAATTSAGAAAVAGQSIATGHSYDALGNNTAQTLSAAQPASSQLSAWTVSPGIDNRMPNMTSTNPVAPTGWSYNKAGEALTVGRGVGNVPALNLTWDSLGRLQRVTSAGVDQAYTYAPSGMRFSIIDNVDPSRSRKYVYTSSGQLLTEYDTKEQWLRDVIYFAGVAIAELDHQGLHELHVDHLGTPKMVTNSDAGQFESELLYGPYGEFIASKGPDDKGARHFPITGFTGHFAEDPSYTGRTGLIYMRGRYYSPVWHRFVNSDGGADPLSPNQYAYVSGSPFMAFDPSGMASLQIYCGGKYLKTVEVTHDDNFKQIALNECLAHLAGATVEVVAPASDVVTIVNNIEFSAGSMALIGPNQAGGGAARQQTKLGCRKAAIARYNAAKARLSANPGGSTLDQFLDGYEQSGNGELAMTVGSVLDTFVTFKGLPGTLKYIHQDAGYALASYRAGWTAGGNHFARAVGARVGSTFFLVGQALEGARQIGKITAGIGQVIYRTDRMDAQIALSDQLSKELDGCR